ncbi:hypothetical protein BCR33DRAFT_779511 [Rhizoclosmatium globosum]|uniref:Uncharacterized protein n=1 Tax=Rhizoclosmatium globosum TaxID=329046 RepID=A0A1Y2D1M0_9FUNG|nr:hypothetical protein BCR33DRAFT_779511 [Rhizoclosmatium globosum]|eukprot:ORY53189.1 hypothetical protein BCR33DRAFT_779511 [Rhizoclosmatium globosum]
MAQLTAPLFAAYAPTLFDSYNQNTDALVWWFARQNDSAQTQVVNGICNSTHPIDTIIETFWGLNSTYLLSSYVQNQMVQCIASISSPQIVTTYLTENYITGSLIFGWDSFTPKAYIWFNTQRDTDKILAVNWLCNSGKPTRLVNNTLRYYQSGNSVYNASVSQGMKLCQNMLPFMQSSLQNSTQHWFQNQTYSIQRPAILRICSNSYFNLTTVKASFRFLMDGLQSPSVQNDVDACLSTYRLNYKLQYYYYTPTAPQSLVWFASQNITTQKRAINYICSGTPGSFIKVQTITEMFDTFQKMGYTSKQRD